MKKITIFLLLFSFFGAYKVGAVFILEPDKDYKMVKREIVNDDGTKTIVEEPEIIKEFPKIIMEPETILKENPPIKKTSNAKGWERKMGTYMPTQPMFSVTRKKPDNWPMDNPIISQTSNTSTDKKKQASPLSWLITAISLGIIGFATFRLYLHFREESDPNKI